MVQITKKDLKNLSIKNNTKLTLPNGDYIYLVDLVDSVIERTIKKIYDIKK